MTPALEGKLATVLYDERLRLRRIPARRPPLAESPQGRMKSIVPDDVVDECLDLF